MLWTDCNTLLIPLLIKKFNKIFYICSFYIFESRAFIF